MSLRDVPFSIAVARWEELLFAASARSTRAG
jgi:hypothetical protein